MRTISIGDIHGRTYWKEIDPSKYDKIIFDGDYVDSFYHTEQQIFENLREIIQLKKDHPDKVVLILGNHDLQYMWSYSEFGCSGYRGHMYDDLHDLFYENKDLFQVAFQIENYIWTHAGISKGWYNFNREIIEAFVDKFETKTLADTLNGIMQTKDNPILHQVGDYRGGVYEYGGITWADRKETMNGYLPGYHQIVGHTPILEITKFGDENGSIRYIDVLGKVAEREEQAKFYEAKYNEKFNDEFPVVKFYEFELNS
jgi:hypothetical protein